MSVSFEQVQLFLSLYRSFFSKAPPKKVAENTSIEEVKAVNGKESESTKQVDVKPKEGKVPQKKKDESNERYRVYFFK